MLTSLLTAAPAGGLSEVSMYFDGQSEILVGFNGVARTLVANPLTGLPLNNTGNIVVGVQTQDAIARTISLDQLLVIQER